MKATVIGAGPCGLSAAVVLAEAGVEVTVIDRETFVGGASASRPIGDGSARMDFGPHVFHLKNEEVNSFFLRFAGNCPTKKRNERIMVRGRLFRYPLEITEVLRLLTPGHLLWMGTAYLLARLRYRLMPSPDESFEAWGVQRFGRPLYEFTCGRYTEKIWGVRPSTLSAKLAQQKLKDLRLRDILAKLVGGRGEEHLRYWEDYLYPEDGIGTVFEAMAAHLVRHGGRILPGLSLDRMEGDERRVTAVIGRRGDGKEERVETDFVVNTAPLTALARAISAGGDRRSADHARLRYRGLILVNVEFACDRLTPYDWVYLLEDIYRCNRFTEQKNMGGRMVPDGRTVLCFELAASPGDALWSMPDELIGQLVLEDIAKIDFIDASLAGAIHVSRLEDAYPMYVRDYDRVLDETLARLSSHENLLSAGRQGLYLNSDIHDSMEMGMLAARHLLSGRNVASWYQLAAEYTAGRIRQGAVAGLKR